MSYNKEEKEERKRQLDNKVKEALTALSSPEILGEYLSFAAKFNKYSQRNIALIYSQNPKASFVAAASFFKAGMPDYNGEKRTEKQIFINKGEKALYILKPYDRKFVRCDGELIPYANLNKDEKKQVSEEDILIRTTYIYVPVFDIAQTNAPPEAYPKLMGFGGTTNRSVEEQYNGVVRYAEQELNCPVTVQDLKRSKAVTKGYYNTAENSIVLSDMLSGDGKLSTLLHEVGHAELHRNLRANIDKPSCVVEYEADLYAFLLEEHLGIGSVDSRTRHLQRQHEAMRHDIPDEKELAKVKNDCLENAVMKYQKQAELFDWHIEAAARQLSDSVDTVDNSEKTNRKTHRSL